MNETAAKLPNQDWSQTIEPDWVKSVPYTFAKRHSVLVICKQDEQVQVACAQAPALSVANELRRQLGLPLAFHTLGKVEFERLLRLAYDKGQSEATQMIDDLGEDADLERLAQEIPEATDLLEAADEAPIVRLINALLTQAIRESASDIHIEVFETRSVVRMRVDGLLRDVVEPQRRLHGALVARIKVMAKLDIAEKRLPQDGRMSLRVGEHPVDVRVSTLPTQHGERVVLRLLDKHSSRLDIGELGMTDAMKKDFDHLIHTPHGIVLVTGPTGSGKTTTLYAGLIRLDRHERNILTVEDPIEYDLDGVGQTQVNAKVGLSFAYGLRSILRQDPDVVLVGEIRDLETAEIAVQASLTGHLVLSTLHTNTAIGAVIRLVDMGVEAFLISSSLLAVLSQRLVRRLCLQCRESSNPDHSERQLLGISVDAPATIYRAKGCEACEFTGYRGRIGIFELITVDEALQGMIHDRVSEDRLLRHVRTQSPSLAANGYERVLQGVTTLDEVLRVTREG